MQELSINYKLLTPTAKLPTKSNFEDGGWDLYADEKVVVKHGELPAKIKTGLAIAIPKGYVGLIFDRSGLGINHGLVRVAGVIDSSYRGEIVVGLSSSVDFVDYAINKGDRVAQLVIVETPLHVTWNKVDELNETDRGDKGFGSSGV